MAIVVLSSSGGGGGGGDDNPLSKSQLVANQPYDEAVALSDEDSMDSMASPHRMGGGGADGGGE